MNRVASLTSAVLLCGHVFLPPRRCLPPIKRRLRPAKAAGYQRAPMRKRRPRGADDQPYSNTLARARGPCSSAVPLNATAAKSLTLACAAKRSRRLNTFARLVPLRHGNPPRGALPVFTLFVMHARPAYPKGCPSGLANIICTLQLL